MPSRHPRAAALIAAGFYRGLSSFRELEARIAALPEELARGDAFEIFVEGYLWTMRVFQSADLWLVGKVPLDVRRALNLPADAKGIDGVFRTKAGQNVPYQVKFRIGRAMLGVAEVATFLGLTERASDRLLVSNANRCAPDVANRDGLRLLRGSDFDALAPEDLAAIAAWLDERPVERSRAAPRADQAKALAGIADALQTHPRATVVMPCGTGKTLVQLWAAERLSPRTVLVLVPSLALLSQTLGEWSHHTSWGNHFEYLCVCSDPTVSAEQDAIVIRSTDVPFHVDTDPAIVRRFLNRPAKGAVRVVFSTYQSAPVVARGLRGLAPFDLGVFDEAHKTTGLLGGTFAFALDDARLRVRKRLFFTATPRHIDIRRRDREGDFPVVSMDDPTVYGPRAYTQTFADAVALGIICDYRVVVAVIDPAEVDSFAMHHGITLVKGDQQATRWVATQIAVSKAIRATGATRVITFHARIQQAALFASDTPRGIGQYLDGFIVNHVNGTQRVADRKDILSGFRDAHRRLVTNARCLTEGVDLPAVDMVVFSNPRRSRVDIVQAVGRAMRKPRDGAKTLGYVVVPVLLAPPETADLAEACAETDWEDVVDVLQALREQDTRLDEIIRVQQVGKGRGEVFNPRAFAERVQVLGPLVALEVLERHIGAVVLESLGTSWDERYGQLVAFKLREGHCNVPIGYPKNPQLASWLRTQRHFKRRGTLSSDRIRRLDELGIAWDPYDAAWEDMFRQLEAFKAREGHCNVSQGYPSPLGIWLNSQRGLQRRGKLHPERIKRLERLGVTWEPREALWEAMFHSLVAFKEMHGHCNVPAKYPENQQLGTWLDTVRQSRKRGRLSSDRIARLDALGITWEVRDTVWEDMFQALLAFKAQHGNCYVPQIHPESPRLLTWMNNQRSRKRSGSLSQERIDRLTKIGFPWDPHDSFWEEMFQSLVRFKAQHGHCKVPKHYPESPQLPTWVQTQRGLKARGRISGEDIGRLEELGFLWQPHRTIWQQRLEELAEFKAAYGHCNVPAVYPDNPSLGRWLDHQRQKRKGGTLLQGRGAQLEALGVVWEQLDDFWEQRLQDLATFKAHHGHCNVPVSYPENPVLGTWLNNQRRLKRSRKLVPDRVKRLEQIGVVWDPQHAVWEQRFEELGAFKTREGHCDVRQDYPDNPSLGHWLSTQRQFKRRGTLSRDRIHRLEALGVVWSTADTAWEHRFQELVEFRAREGHSDVPQDYHANPHLGRWLSKQRQAKSTGTLSQNRVKRLEALGVTWEPLDEAWELRFQDMMAFKKREGHCNVPQSYPENPQLGVWLSRQRRAAKRNTLSHDRVKRLESLGVVWEPRDATWEQRCQELAAFKAREGHANVSRESDDLGLARWLVKQRERKARGTLSQDRIERLETLGVAWEPYDAAWEERFQELVAFKKRYRHGDGRPDYAKHPQLATWLERQRAMKRTDRLSADRIGRLEAVGMIWEPHAANWEQRFQELRAFKMREGHCNVPAHDPENPQLGKWLTVQRGLKRSRQLPGDRIERLEALGIVWKLRAKYKSGRKSGPAA